MANNEYVNGVLTDPHTGNQFINGTWTDPKTGNRMVNGMWQNPQGATFTNGQWYNGQNYTGQQPQQSRPPASAMNTANQFMMNGSGGGAYGVVPGFQWQVDNLNRQHQSALQQLNNATRVQLQQMDAGLQRELQQGKINADQYMQSRNLAQQESEFARQLAQRQLEMERDNKIKEAELEISKAAEMRQERQLQANLDANPADFVASQFYKRMLGTPGAWDVAQKFAAGGTATPAAAGAIDPSNPTNINGEPYSPAAPAYSDQTLQTVAGSIYAGGGAPLYNPGLSGKGAFGAAIDSPNSISRATGQGMSDSEMGVLSSFLRAGVEGPGGKRVAIDPGEFFQQVEGSWIPTLAGGAGGGTQYR